MWRWLQNWEKDTVNLCFVEKCEEGETRKNIVGFCWISRPGFIFAMLHSLLCSAKQRQQSCLKSWIATKLKTFPSSKSFQHYTGDLVTWVCSTFHSEEHLPVFPLHSCTEIVLESCIYLEIAWSGRRAWSHVQRRPRWCQTCQDPCWRMVDWS